MAVPLVRQSKAVPRQSPGQRWAGALLGKNHPRLTTSSPCFFLSHPLAFAIQCEREEEVRAKPPPILVPSSPDIYVKLTSIFIF